MGVPQYALVLVYSQTIDEFKPDYFDIQRGHDDYDLLCCQEEGEREIHYGPEQELKTYANLHEANQACKELFRDTVADTLDFGEHMEVDNIGGTGGTVRHGMDWIDEYAGCRYAPDGRVSYSHSENYDGSDEFNIEGIKWSFSASCQVIKLADDE
jgi:hypothetical protein